MLNQTRFLDSRRVDRTFESICLRNRFVLEGVTGPYEWIRNILIPIWFENILYHEWRLCH